MELILAQLSESAPWLIPVLFWVGLSRSIMKVLMTAAGDIIKITPTLGDDVWWEKLLKHKAYKAVSFVLDYLASVKLPQLKEPEVK